MKILFFSPAPSQKDFNMCPFILQRIVELQKNRIDVEVLQYGNLRKRKLGFSNRVGILRIFANIKRIICFVFEELFFPVKLEKREYNRNGIRYIYYDSIVCRNYKDFYNWFCKKKFDLIHAHFLWFAELLPVLKENYGIPYVITGHGSDIHETPFSDTSKKLIYADILNKSDKVIFVSNFLRKKSLDFGFYDKNYEIIYNGFDPESFYFNEKKECSDFFPVLGFVGHTIKVKRCEILPDVLFHVKKYYPNVLLYIIGFQEGTEDLTPELQRRVKELNLEDSVVFTGRVLPEDVANYMRNLDLLLLPSLNEGFPCVAIEAQACGTAVVGSANGGIPEAIGNNGVCVRESENFIIDYANAIIEYLSKKHPSKRDISNSVKQFEWKYCVEKEIMIYREIIDKRQEIISEN